MKVIFTKQEIIDVLRAQYNLHESVDIEIIDSDTTGANDTKDWIAVPKDWNYEIPLTFATTKVEVMFNNSNVESGFADKWSASWNQRRDLRIVKYRILNA